MIRETILASLVIATAGVWVHAGVIASETFDADGTLADYSGAGKVFSANVMVGDAASSVSGGKLNMQMLAGTTGADTLYAHVDLGTAKPLLNVKFDLEGVQYSAASGAFQLYVGSFNTIADFEPGWNPSGNGRSWARTVIASGAPYTVTAYAPTAAAGSTTGTVGQTYTWNVFLNDSGITQSFTGPDAASHSLNDKEWTMFVGSTIVAANIPKGTSGDSTDLQGIVFMTSRNYDGGKSSTNIDNLVVRDDFEAFVPEPTTAGIVAASAMATMLRRRKHSV